VTTPSLYETTGLSISIGDNILLGGRQRLLIRDSLEGYSHTILANGGFDTMNVSAAIDRFDIDYWLDKGIGGHVEVRDESLTIVWEGVVNSIQITIGGITYLVGNFTDIINRCSVVYSWVDTTTSPPTMGSRMATPAINDTASQALYGILEQQYSIGGCTDANAYIIRALRLAELAYPKKQQNAAVFSGGTEAVKVTFSCIGYAKAYMNYLYPNTATGTVAISTRLGAVITADPNVIISRDYSGITANAVTVESVLTEGKPAWNYMQSLATKGDTNNYRYSLGIYEKRKVFYTARNPATGVISYLYSPISSPEQKLTSLAGQRVRPWNVRPARWLQLTDVFIGRNYRGNFDLNPNIMYLESVTYTAPWTLQFSGGGANTLMTFLARLGLSGG
jgi:hypothetical protein